MPKATRRPHNHLRFTADPISMPASINTSSQMAYYSGRNGNMAAYYEPLSATTPQTSLSMPPYEPYAVAAPPPPLPALTIPSNTSSYGHALPSSAGGHNQHSGGGGSSSSSHHHQQRASSGAWTPEDDRTLIHARQNSMNWSQIQTTHFPNKTSNACRKRHERLMERKGADDWDQRKLEILAREYINLRKQIWTPLAQATGEKWTTVELRCMSTGLKNLQSASRQGSRRERTETVGHVGYDDGDSGVSGIGLTPIDERDHLPYSPPSSAGSGSSSGHHVGGHHGGSSSYPQTAPGGGPYQTNTTPGGYYAHAHGHHHHGGHGHGHSASFSSTTTAAVQGGSHSPSPYLGQRLSSVDMGIESLIHRGPGGSGNQGV